MKINITHSNMLLFMKADIYMTGHSSQKKKKTIVYADSLWGDILKCSHHIYLLQVKQTCQNIIYVKTKFNFEFKIQYKVSYIVYTNMTYMQCILSSLVPVDCVSIGSHLWFHSNTFFFFFFFKAVWETFSLDCFYIAKGFQDW